MTMGASVTISRYFGAGDHDRVSRAIHTNILVSMCSGILLTVCGVAFTPTILRWMGTDPEVLPEAVLEKLEKELQRQADAFEQEVHSGISLDACWPSYSTTPARAS